MSHIQPNIHIPKNPRTIGRYTAQITQSGTDAPTARILYQKLPPNTQIIWTRDSQGVYSGTFTPTIAMPYSTAIMCNIDYTYNINGIVASAGGTVITIRQVTPAAAAIDGFSINLDITFWDTNDYNPWND